MEGSNISEVEFLVSSPNLLKNLDKKNPENLFCSQDFVKRLFIENFNFKSLSKEHKIILYLSLKDKLKNHPDLIETIKQNVPILFCNRTKESLSNLLQLFSQYRKRLESGELNENIKEKLHNKDVPLAFWYWDDSFKLIDTIEIYEQINFNNGIYKRPKIIKTKSRIKATGEVFTPTPLVQEILNKLPKEIFEDPNKTFLDPSCGDGQFLSEVLIRKMEHGSTFEQALSTIYGVDIMKDNVEVCRERLLCGYKDENLIEIVERNIVHGDTLRPEGYGEIPQVWFLLEETEIGTPESPKKIENKKVAQPPSPAFDL